MYDKEKTNASNIEKEEEALKNFKGIYYNNPTNKYFDPITGAHFEYSDMCKRLEQLLTKRQAEVPPANSMEFDTNLSLNLPTQPAVATLDPIVKPKVNKTVLKETVPRELPKELFAKVPPKVRLVAARLPSESPTSNHKNSLNLPSGKGPVQYLRQLKHKLVRGTNSKGSTIRINKKMFHRAGTEHDIGDCTCPPADLTTNCVTNMQLEAFNHQAMHHSFQNYQHKRCKSECVGYIPRENVVTDLAKSRNKKQKPPGIGNFFLPDPRKAHEAILHKIPAQMLNIPVLSVIANSN